jgi:hypothetical protein
LDYREGAKTRRKQEEIDLSFAPSRQSKSMAFRVSGARAVHPRFVFFVSS